jgi:hypothetical protein
VRPARTAAVLGALSLVVGCSDEFGPERQILDRAEVLLSRDGDQVGRFRAKDGDYSADKDALRATVTTHVRGLSSQRWDVDLVIDDESVDGRRLPLPDEPTLLRSGAVVFSSSVDECPIEVSLSFSPRDEVRVAVGVACATTSN